MQLLKSPLYLLLAFLFCTSSQSFSQTQDTITWMEAVAPPFFIHKGPLKGQGYEDIITAIIAQNLPQYEHKHMIANISRHYQQWKQGEKSCALAMYKTPEREEFAYFSIPSVFTLPIVLIITKDSFERFGGNKNVSLQDVLENNSYIVGRSKNRSYGIIFDEVLNTYGNDQNIYSFEGGELSLNLFKMLLAGRIDALPALPEEAMYLAETLGFKEQIMTLGIVENQQNNEASITYVACSKNDWGKRAIDDINTVLVELRPTTAYRAAYERWLDPSSINNYRQLYQDNFLTITK